MRRSSSKSSSKSSRRTLLGRRWSSVSVQCVSEVGGPLRQHRGEQRRAHAIAGHGQWRAAAGRCRGSDRGHATRAVLSGKVKIRILIIKWPFDSEWPFDSSAFRLGAKCCMGAPRGDDFLFAPLGAGGRTGRWSRAGGSPWPASWVDPDTHSSSIGIFPAGTDREFLQWEKLSAKKISSAGFGRQFRAGHFFSSQVGFFNSCRMDSL